MGACYFAVIMGILVIKPPVPYRFILGFTTLWLQGLGL